METGVEHTQNGVFATYFITPEFMFEQ